MLLTVYRATEARDVPEALFWAMDGVDTRYIAAFDNYPKGEKVVVAAWGTTGGSDVKGQPIVALVATTDHIITGYVDLLTYHGADDDDADDLIDDDEGDEEDDDDYAYDEDDDYDDPYAHQEPDAAQRRATLLAWLRREIGATWLLVHDADEIEGWTEQGFVVIDPPPDVPADQAVLVLAWGKLPDDAYALLRAWGLSWNRDVHRGYARAP